MKGSYRDLFVWNASVDLAVSVIRFSDELIAERRFAIADQLVRAALSVPSNIAEGAGRLTTRDRRHFLSQARGSLFELDTQMEVVTRADLLPTIPDFHDVIARVGAGLSRMIDYRSLRL